MKVLVNGWRQSLAAVALAAVLGPAAGDSSRTRAAEGDQDVPRIKIEREGGERPAAKPEREGEGREVRKEREERRPEAREERKPEARGERERDREGGAEREARARAMAQRRAHLQEEAAGLRRKLEALKPDQDGEARELKGALERIEVQLRELQAPAANRERVQARLEELRAAHRRAKEAGREDEAERLEREGRELLRMLEQRPGERPPENPPPPVPSG